MKGKKLVFSAFVIVIALSIVAASGRGPLYFEIEAGETAEFYVGRAGVSFTNSHYPGTVKLKRTTAGYPPGEKSMYFTQRMLDARFSDTNGDRITHVLGPVYVFFKTKKFEMKRWNSGELSIYYFDTWKQEWKVCPTFSVNGNRLACRIRIFGLYGLGMEK